jgi:hypothetical protein
LENSFLIQLTTDYLSTWLDLLAGPLLVFTYTLAFLLILMGKACVMQVFKTLKTEVIPRSNNTRA